MTVVYNFVFIMFAIAYFPYLVFTGRWHKDFRQRFGILPQGPLDALRGKDIIWVHAVSVGEVTAVKSFCDELIKRHPSKKVLISTVTRTGNTVAKKLFKNRAEYVYLPLDLSWIVNSVLNKIRPRVFVIVETEIWPNLTTALFKKDIPVILINGRISQGSFKSL